MSLPPRSSDELVGTAFLPLHKLAFGVATGLMSAMVLFLATAIYLIRSPETGFELGLLAQYFSGYSVSWPGAFIGAGWAGFSGFILGWFFAFCRNALLAMILLTVRRRAELRETSDLIDQI